MAHLNGHKLQRWEPGDRLQAEGLNHNFATLAEIAEAALLQARTPDQTVVRLEMATGRLAERLDVLERLANMHERQRNEKEWAPLSHLGAIVTMVNDLRQQVEAAVARIDQMHAGLSTNRDELNRRLARIEQQPDAATEEDFSFLARDHERVALEQKGMLAQIVALQGQLQTLTDWALGKDQRVNRVEYAPLAYFGELVRRIEKLEERV